MSQNDGGKRNLSAQRGHVSVHVHCMPSVLFGAIFCEFAESFFWIATVTCVVHGYGRFMQFSIASWMLHTCHVFFSSYHPVSL